MKTKHLTSDDLIGYIYRMLDDAQREIIDAHLLDCPTCRANLTEQELRQRQVSNELSAVLNAATPSPQMSFNAIRSQLQIQQKGLNLWPRLAAVAPPTFALLGLLFALFGLWQAFGVRAYVTSTPSLGAFPTLAGFFLVLASVQQFDRPLSVQPRLVITWLLAAILWLGSAFLGLLDLIAIRDLAILAVAAVNGRGAQAGPIAIMAVYLGTLLFIGLVIGGGEYHYKNIGQPSSWKLFTISLLGQLFILILPYLIFIGL
jgi:hypothetical protein